MSFEQEEQHRRQYDPMLVQIFTELRDLKGEISDLKREYGDLRKELTLEQLKTSQNASSISFIERALWAVGAVTLAFGDKVVHWFKN